VATVDLYCKYFKHQAIHHPDLCHDDDTQVVFQIIDVQEALSDMRSAKNPKLIYMRLIQFSSTTEDNQADDTQEYLTGAFQILAHHSDRSSKSDHLKDVLEKTKKITDEIKVKMIADSNDGHPLFYYSLNTAKNFRVVPFLSEASSGYSGWSCSFQFSNHFSVCVGDTAWKDSGKTPHAL